MKKLLSTKLQQLDNSEHSGYIYAIISQILFSFVGLILKFTTLHAFQAIYMRNLAVLIINYGMIIWSNPQALELTKNLEKIMCLRGLIGVVAQAMAYHVVIKLPLSEGKVLTSTTPIFATLMCNIFLNEQFTRLQLITMIICLFAVILIMKPNFIWQYLPNSYQIQSSTSIIWYFVALLVAFFRAINIIMIRMLKGKTNENSLVHYFCIFGVTLSVPFIMYTDYKKPVLSDYIWLFGIMGFIATAGQILNAKAIFREQPSKITVVSFIQVILSYLYDIYLLDIKIDWMSTLGIAIVCFSIINLILNKQN